MNWIHLKKIKWFLSTNIEYTVISANKYILAHYQKYNIQHISNTADIFILNRNIFIYVKNRDIYILMF